MNKTLLIITLTLLTIPLTYGQIDTTKTDTTENTSIFNYVSPSYENSGGFNLDVGASLIRNTITPTFNFNLHYYRDNKHKFQLGTLTNFLFERDSSKKFLMYPNTFIKVEMYWKINEKKDLHKFNDSSWSGIGLAYLINNKGGYFDGPTFKIYHIFGLNGGLEIAAELLITNDFKSFFPGLTITFL